MKDFILIDESDLAHNRRGARVLINRGSILGVLDTFGGNTVSTLYTGLPSLSNNGATRSFDLRITANEFAKKYL